MKKLDGFGLPVNPGTYCDPAEGKTVQQDVDGTDINKILHRAGISDPSQLPLQPGLYMDVSELHDYRFYADKLAAAGYYFDQELPADVRLSFGNSVLNFLDAVNDPDQYDRLVKIGVFKAPEPEAAPDVPVVSSDVKK